MAPPSRTRKLPLANERLPSKRTAKAPATKGGRRAQVPPVADSVVAKRILNGKVQYQVKWRNNPNALATWESAENVKPISLLADFESIRQMPVINPKVRRQNRRRGKTPPNPVYQTSFRRGLHPEKILNITDATGDLQFLVKFFGEDVPEMIPKRVMYRYCPMMALEYFESLFQWKIVSSLENS